MIAGAWKVVEWGVWWVEWGCMASRVGVYGGYIAGRVGVHGG